MPIRSGDLRDPIVLERQGAGTDDYGGETGTWSELVRTRARLLYGTGQERRQAAQEQASVSAIFRVRRSTVTAGMAAKDRIRFDPLAPLPDAPLPDDFPAWNIISVVPFGSDGIDITAVREAA